MSSVFTKSKKKRARTSSNEANNSFVKNVTSRVSGLLPSKITSWFSPKSSNSNGSAPTADATDSSTDDEAVPSPIISHPPIKRRKYTSSVNSYTSTVTETNYSPSGDSSQLQEPYNVPFDAAPSSTARMSFRREPNMASTSLRNDDQAQDTKDKDFVNFMYKSSPSVSTIGSTVAKKRKSLFNTSGSSDTSIQACSRTASNTAVDTKKPCFKPSLLGSPFYPGRTMYGGASASYINHPNIKNRTNTTVNESNTADNTISLSTKRIMDLLEHYSSPLSEAKRIAQYPKTPRIDNSSFSSSVPAQKSFSYKTQELHVPAIASILQLKRKSRLMDTTNAARQLMASHSSTDFAPYRLSSRDTRDASEEQSSNKFTTKIKIKLTRSKRGGNDIEKEPPTPTELPSASLEIDLNNLPQFSFGSPSQKHSTPIKETPITLPRVDNTATIKNKPQTIITICKPEPVSSIKPYIFSSPVTVTSVAPQSVSTPTKFTFGGPDRSIDRCNEKKDDAISPVLGAGKLLENKQISSKSKGWKCPDCWVANDDSASKCVCCSCAKPGGEGNKEKESNKMLTDDSNREKESSKELCTDSDRENASNKKPEEKVINIVEQKKCTLCKLSDSQSNNSKCYCEKVTTSSAEKLQPLQTANTTKWKCDECWVYNDEDAEKCPCCGAANTKKTKLKDGSDATSDWKCEDCWIKNKSSVDKCVACGGTRLGSKAVTTPAASSQPASGFFSSATKSDSLIKLPVKSKSDKWNCSICLVQNDNNKTKCACCEADKPGNVKEADKKSFNFGMNTTTKFKFGIDPTVQVASNKPDELNANENKKPESETNNNVLSRAPSFTFPVPAKKSSKNHDYATKIEEKTDSAPKPTFSFGLPTPVIAPTLTFGIPDKAQSTVVKPKPENEEKPQEVPKVDLSAQTGKEAPILPNVFAPPVTTPISTDKPASVNIFAQDKPAPVATAASAPVLNSVIPLGVSTESTLTLPNTTTNTSSTSQPSFTFGSGMKIPSNLFTAPATTSITFGTSTPIDASKTTSMFTKPETSTAKSLPFFPRTETTQSAPLFQNNENKLILPSAPLFNFGTNVPAPQPQAEKPKFNFTFGSNNKTDTSIFKSPTFPVATENKFTLPNRTANNLVNNNSITGGTIGGAGLTNSLGNNGLGINPLTAQGDMSNNPTANNNSMQTPNAFQSSGVLFGTPAQEENIWSSGNNSASGNPFGTSSNTNTNALQKPLFTFGGSTPINSTNNTAPVFGASAQQNTVFGMPNNNTNNQVSMFTTTEPQSTNVFGSSTGATNGVFGSPSAGATPSFGTPNASIPSFEAPSLTPAPAPAFNFGAPQASSVFGFGGQQPQPQPQQAYNFSATPAGGLQFSMGSQSARPVRRARRKNQR